MVASVARKEGVVDKRAAVVLGVIFGGLFLVLFSFMILAYSAVRGTSLELGSESSSGARVAIIELRGAIGSGPSENGVDGDKVVKNLRKLEKEDDVKAIVLRVDSPGGAVAPSQEIYDAVKRIKLKKKVVVSMGNLAASGGYYVSAPADKIFAEPGTLTGSIGVIFQHFNVRGALEMIHVEPTTLKSGKYKDTLSPFRPIQDTDREEIQGISDDVYGQFVHAVAQGRGLKDEDVRKIAEGRIYTGKRAKELKLVDELGGLDDAIAAAWTMAGQSGEPRVQTQPKERELSLRDLMRGAFQGAAQGVREGATQSASSGLMFLAPSLVP
jgi:protease-4